MRDLDDALVSGVLADRVLAMLQKGALDPEAREAAVTLARFAELAIAFRTGELSSIEDRDVRASTVYSLLARAVARVAGPTGGISALRRYAQLLRSVAQNQLPARERAELMTFLDTVSEVSLDSARGKVGALLGAAEDRRGRPWTRS
jgi:hypothetical protein